MSVVIVSNIVPHEGRTDDVLSILQAAVPAIQTQSGCELYAIHRGRGRARGRLCLLEKWADDEALERYGNSAELLKLHDDLEPLIHSLEDFFVFAPVAIGDPSKGTI